MFRLALFVVGLLAFPSPAIVGIHRAQVGPMTEFRFVSDLDYSNPHADVALWCDFRGPDGENHRVRGFWNGGREFVVRFSFPGEGLWSFSTSCSDTLNSGLHGRNSDVDVVLYSGSNPLYAHGGLRVSDNRRYLSHADGQPFFYLADTAWEITWKSDSTAFLDYLADRKQKGFTAIQLVAMTHQAYNYRENGVTNRKGHTSFLHEDYGFPNPRYFDYLDFIVQMANNNGLVVAVVPLWASSIELYESESPFGLTPDQAMIFGRYLGARYAGSQMIWLMGGDNYFDTPERQDFWGEFANDIHAANGNRQLVTLHPAGWTASFHHFDSDTEWLDFHMYQSSHLAGGDFTWIAGSQGYALDPAFPVVNGEACYEDIYHNLWEPGDTTQTRTFRIRPRDVRQASYESILSGGIVGITYGANGVWQWHRTDLPGTHLPRYVSRDAWSFVGSEHMSILKDFLRSVPWYELEPRQDLLEDFESQENYITVASTKERIVSFVPYGTSSISIITSGFADSVLFTWVDPTTGISLPQDHGRAILNLQPPDTTDWILLIETDPGASKISLETPLLHENFPNPFRGATALSYELPRASQVDFGIFDVRGRRVRTIANGPQKAGRHVYQWTGTDDRGVHLASGIYFMRFEVSGSAQTKKMVLLK